MNEFLTPMRMTNHPDCPLVPHPDEKPWPRCPHCDSADVSQYLWDVGHSAPAGTSDTSHGPWEMRWTCETCRACGGGVLPQRP